MYYEVKLYYSQTILCWLVGKSSLVFFFQRFIWSNVSIVCVSHWLVGRVTGWSVRKALKSLSVCISMGF